MKNYYKLSLPSNPLNSVASHKILKLGESNKHWYKAPHWHTYTDPELINETLLPEVTELLNSAGLKTTLIVVFFTNNDVSQERSFVHKDISLINNQWITTPFGINFEINPTTTSKITWWDTEDKQEFYDDTAEFRVIKKNLMGIRYHPDYLRSSPKYLNFSPIETVEVKGESTGLLFRTDVAHSVASTTLEGIRYNVSLRFDSTQIASFDEAVNKLKNFILPK